MFLTYILIYPETEYEYVIYSLSLHMYGRITLHTTGHI